jgi:hypothetical protein
MKCNTKGSIIMIFEQADSATSTFPMAASGAILPDWRRRVAASFAACVLAFLIPHLTQAEVPSLTWTPYVGATVIGVDSQTNVYANSAGTIYVFNGNCVPVSTNYMCPNAGLAQRDATGNFYFAGVFNGVINFGSGVTLSNTQPATSGFVVKFTAGGAAIWAHMILSPYDLPLSLRDFQVELGGASYVDFDSRYSNQSSTHAAYRFDTSGSNTWGFGGNNPDGVNYGYQRLGGVSATNGLFLSYDPGYPSSFAVNVSRFDAFGGLTQIASWHGFSGNEPTMTHPAVNSVGEIYFSQNGVLNKLSPGLAPLWSKSTGGYTIAPDFYGGVYVTSDSGPLSRYDSDSNLAWTISYLPAPCNAVVMDSYGNRFISLTTGAIARLGPEAVSAPVITNPPVSLTTFAGSNAAFTVGASGFSPIRYYWLYQGNSLVGPTNSPTLTLNSVSPSQAGNYSVIVSNYAGSVTSSPALLRVKNVEIFWGSQLLANGTYTFTNPPTLSVRSAYPGGSTFYTLDGSAPTFASTPYSGPFTLTNSALVRALGYSSDFSQSEEADQVNAIVPQRHTLSISNSVGGTVSANPPGPTYLPTDTVTLTANPQSGSSFIGWSGDASGSSPTVSLLMDRDKAVYAQFGTTLSTTATGGGQVLVDPARAAYPYGSVVRLTAVPQAGNYFGLWGNAASGNTNPLYFTVSAPTQTVSSIFAPVPAGQAALTVEINGGGTVSVNPRANVYPTNQSVTLMATPNAGQLFLPWGGDASGSQNPLTVLMTQSKAITANFSSPGLIVNRSQGDGFSTNGFNFTLVGNTQSVWRVLNSTDLSTWNLLTTVTNTQLQMRLNDPAAVGRPNSYYKATPGP